MAFTYKTRSSVCGPVAQSLREFGYPDVTTEMVKAILDAWLEGKRDAALPHGVIGMFAARQFEEVEEAAPGRLALLKNS